MKKVLVVIQNSEIGGGPRIANSIILSLKDDFHFYAFYPRKGSAIKELEKDKFTDIVYPEKDFLFNISYSIKKIIKELNPDIIHAHGTKAAFWVKLAMFLGAPRKRIIYTLHGVHYIRKNFVKKNLILLIERLSNKLVDYLVCVSKSDFKLANQLNLIDGNKILTIENCIKIEDIQKGYRKSDRITITTICRLHFQKDIKTLIKAINIIRNDNIKLLIVGDGPERKRLEDLSNRLNLNDKIEFLGEQKDTRKILSQTDIFVLSTKWEGLPVSLLEAMAAKKPVVGSNVDGVKELIINGKNGLLFEVGNSWDLADKLAILIKNEKIRKSMGNYAYKLVKEKYNIKSMINSYAELYKRISKSD